MSRRFIRALNGASLSAEPRLPRGLRNCTIIIALFVYYICLYKYVLLFDVDVF